MQNTDIDKETMETKELLKIYRWSRETLDKQIENGLPFLLKDPKNPKSHKQFLKTEVDAYLLESQVIKGGGAES